MHQKRKRRTKLPFWFWRCQNRTICFSSHAPSQSKRGRRWRDEESLLLLLFVSQPTVVMEVQHGRFPIIFAPSRHCNSISALRYLWSYDEHITNGCSDHVIISSWPHRLQTRLRGCVWFLCEAVSVRGCVWFPQICSMEGLRFTTGIDFSHKVKVGK